MGQRVGRSQHKLSATAVAKLKTTGYYGDGGGLWLQVSQTGTKSWIFRFTISGRAREMGLGPYPDVPLAGRTEQVADASGGTRTIVYPGARDKAAECRNLTRQGIDPIEARQVQRSAVQEAAAKVLTFDQCAERYIEDNRAGWRNDKHADQWQSTLGAYASPVFGALSVAAVNTALVMKVLQPIWTTKTETAKRVRGRVESVLSWATVRGYRSGDNPARWRGHLDQLLPKPEKVTKVEHHAALPYAEIGGFMQRLRAEDGTAARAVEFIILTACRTSEALNAGRSEVDAAAAVWTIPAERTKAGRAHRVPLSKPALALVKQAIADPGSDYIFQGAKEGKPLSNMAGLQLLKRMGRSDITVHGFRSTFRDWAREQTNFPREVVEAALAHVVADKTEAAYARGDVLAKRARLMDAWAAFCARVAPVANVVEIQNRAAQ